MLFSCLSETGRNFFPYPLSSSSTPYVLGISAQRCCDSTKNLCLLRLVGIIDLCLYHLSYPRKYATFKVDVVGLETLVMGGLDLRWRRVYRAGELDLFAGLFEKAWQISKATVEPGE